MDPDQHLTRPRVRPLATALVALALVATARGGDGDDDTSTDDSTSSTSSSSTTSVTLPATSTSTSSTSTTSTTSVPADEPDCPGSGGLPPQAENNSLAGGDVDGDGQIDTIHSYTIGDPGQAGAWWIQISFAGGGGSAMQVDGSSTTLSGVRVFDGFDVNGNGKDEFFATVGAGASLTLIGLFEVIDCQLHWVTVGGTPSEIAVGASINFVSGLECLDLDLNDANDFVVLFSGQRLGESPEFEITIAEYALQDGELEFVQASGGGGNVNDADFGRYSSAGCPGLESL